MKEEEIIKKLESIDLPKIEVQSYRHQLRTALLQSRYFRENPENGVLNLAKSKIMEGLIARRPVWQTALVTALVVTMILGLGLILPLVLRQAPSQMQPEWLEYTRDSEAKGLFYTSLAFDPSGKPAISYWDSSTQALELARWNGISWNIETVDAGYGGSVAFNSSGNPSIAYRSYLADVLKYASWNGSSWDIQTVDIGQIQEVSLSFQPSGNPVIGYHDMSSNEVKYAVWNGASWDIQIAEGEY